MPKKSHIALLNFKAARDGIHKYEMRFLIDGEKSRRVLFGATGYSDYTLHKDDERKRRYIQRHRDKENWADPLTPGALSRWILWNKKTLSASLNHFLKKFKIADRRN